MAITATKTVSLLFKINKIAKNQNVKVVASDNNEGTAKYTTDYDYNPHPIGNVALTTSVSNPGTMTFTIEIKTPNIIDKKITAIFHLNLTDDKKLNVAYKVTVNFNNDDNVFTTVNNTATTAPDTTHWYLRIVTGGNFDFFNGPTIKNFAGDLTAFIPNAVHFADLDIGLDFGINNFHYFNTDSSHTRNDGTAYYLHNKDFYSGNSTSKIVKGITSVNRKYDYNVWGVHLDPLVQIAQNDFVQLYLKLHIEELTTTETYTPSATKSLNDTITLQQYQDLKKADQKLPDPQSRAPVFYPYKQATYYDMYYGIGLPVVINIKNIASLHISPSAGLASIQYADPMFDPNPIQRPVFPNANRHPDHIMKFYTLNKFQLVTTVAPIDIALGGEYRTVAGSLHYLSTYIGATIKLDKLKK